MKIHIHRLKHFFVTTTAVLLIALSHLLESSAMSFTPTPTLKLLSSFPLSKSLSLHILKGSVVEFATSCPQSSAIVNAANEGCLGGGGVDGAITAAGGEDLARDRLALPVLRGGVRCFTGNAVVTGPNQNKMNYGSLAVPYVIHAVGPNFWDFDEAETDMAEQLLQKAYQASLERAQEQGISHVAFSLLSAGIFRGPDLSVRDILRMAVEGIQKWAVESITIDTIDDDHDNDDDDDDDVETKDAAESALISTLDTEQQQQSSLQQIYLCGFTTAEVETLQEVCHEILGEPMEVEDESIHSDLYVEGREEENQPVEAAEEKPQTETLKSRLVARERSESFPSDEEDENTATGGSVVHGPSRTAKMMETQHDEDTEEKKEATTTMNTCTQTTEREETNGKSPAKRPKM